MKKILLVIIYVTVAFNLNAQSNKVKDFSQDWNHKHYNDSILHWMIDDYVKELEDDTGKIIKVHFLMTSDSTEIFRLRASKSLRTMLTLPPSYYFVYKHNIVYVYSGIEYYLNPSSEWLDSLLTLTENILGYKDYNIVSWEKKLFKDMDNVLDYMVSYDPPLYEYKVTVRDRLSQRDQRVIKIEKNKNIKSLIY